MRPRRKIAIIYLLVFSSNIACCQTLDIFDTKLYNEKVSLCDILEKHIDKKNKFEYYPFDSSFFSVTSYNNRSIIFGNWSFVVRHDSLNQIGFTSLDLPITSEWFSKLSNFTDSAIKLFTLKYGDPAKQIFYKANIYKEGKKFVPGEIRKALWILNDQKLIISFSIEGEHQKYYYSVKILRFKDYYGNMLLEKEWDGF